MADKHSTRPADESSADDRPGTEADASTEALESTDPASDLQRERDDYHDRWVRKTAEFDNYRRRIERERREQSDQAVVSLMLELLSVVDDFDRAVGEPSLGGAGSDGAKDSAYRKGVELIHAKLQDVLRKQG